MYGSLAKWISFDNEKSQFSIPGPITSLRPAVPKVPCAALEYAAVLNHWSIVGLASFVLTLKSRFGRQQLPIFALSSPETVSGNPDARVTTEVTFQPPSAVLRAPSVRNWRPGPNGRSYTTEVTNRCRWSNTDGPFSHDR